MTPSTASAGPDPAAQQSAVRALAILDTARDPAFDRLVFVAAQLFRVPIAAVSLMDGERVWYKARVGLAEQATERMVAFCDLAVRQPGPLMIEDAMLDPRFSGNPLVSGTPGIRFYAGAPLMAPAAMCARLGVEALPVGMLCVMDRRRRVVTAAQMAHLVQLAREGSALLAARELKLA